MFDLSKIRENGKGWNGMSSSETETEHIKWTDHNRRSRSNHHSFHERTCCQNRKTKDSSTVSVVVGNPCSNLNSDRAYKTVNTGPIGCSPSSKLDNYKPIFMENKKKIDLAAFFNFNDNY